MPAYGCPAPSCSAPPDARADQTRSLTDQGSRPLGRPVEATGQRACEVRPGWQICRGRVYATQPGRCTPRIARAVHRPRGRTERCPQSPHGAARSAPAIRILPAWRTAPDRCWWLVSCLAPPLLLLGSGAAPPAAADPIRPAARRLAAGRIRRRWCAASTRPSSPTGRATAGSTWPPRPASRCWPARRAPCAFAGSRRRPRRGQHRPRVAPHHLRAGPSAGLGRSAGRARVSRSAGCGAGGHCAGALPALGAAEGSTYLDPLSLVGGQAATAAAARPRRSGPSRRSRPGRAAEAAAALAAGGGRGRLDRDRPGGQSRLPPPGAGRDHLSVRPAVPSGAEGVEAARRHRLRRRLRRRRSGRPTPGTVTASYFNARLRQPAVPRPRHGSTGVSVQTALQPRHAVRGRRRPRVRRGQVLGYVGSTGYSTGCHLHLMVWLDGRLVDPMSWF